MCGIAGIYRFGPELPTEIERARDRATVDAMLRAIEYRGPDDRGIESLGRATMGAQRLAILDVAGGHQPLSDASGRVWASLNGEIYNFPALRSDLATRHVLRTRTDTEILPCLYRERGEEFVRELSGMFGLAVYDQDIESLFLARDPLGVKPLYVAEVGGRLLYASEMKSLLCDPEVPREIDLDALGRYLAMGFVPGEGTIFRAIRKLRPGVQLSARPTGMETRRYYAWPRFFTGVENQELSIPALADEASRRIGASTLSMLHSDVPVGLLLSGGIDSSLLAGLLPVEARRELRTFSIGFEGGGHYDERPYAREVAEHLGTRHREVTVKFDLAAELTRVVGFLDEPCADPAAVPAHLVARAAASEVKVLLSGTGGDEIFGGYRRHRLGALLRQVGWLPRNWARACEQALGERMQHRGSIGAERLVWLRKLMAARSCPRFFDAYLATLAPALPDRWAPAMAVNAGPPGRTGPDLWEEMIAETGRTPLGPEETAFTVDHLYHLPDDLLLKEDRTMMGASVEGRVPFLDASLVEFAAGLPMSSRFRGHEGKQVLREIARRILPPRIARRPKHGFSVPIEEWLRGPLRDLAGDVFAGHGSGVFHGSVLRGWHEQHLRGLDRSGALWAALSFELWWKEIGSASPAALAASGSPLGELVQPAA